LITHTVQKGDSLWKISKAYGVSLESLIAANPQIPNPDKIDVGMQVMIPSGGTMPAPGAMPLPTPEATPTPLPTPGGMTAPDEMPGPAGAQEEKGPATDIFPGGTTTGGMTSAAPMPAPEPMMSTPPAPAYPSVPKWEGLWKYVVKNGDSLFKIAKQVGVTLEQLKAANPQVPNPDKIYPGQVLNIPSSGMKPKSGNPGLSPKEQLTSPMAPMGVSPLSIKEQVTQPKEMAPMETPIQAPVSPIPAAPMPMPAMPHPFEINANLNFSPHDNKKETNIGYFPHHNQMQQAQAVSPAATGPVVAKQEAAPMDMHQHLMMYYHMMPHMYYIPVKMKKKHKKCHHKQHKCGCKKQHHHAHAHWAAYHQMMMQHMGMHPKTFYREED
jgi:spore coat assembly protein SafA